jgi:hypothetical protein
VGVLRCFSVFLLFFWPFDGGALDGVLPHWKGVSSNNS